MPAAKKLRAPGGAAGLVRACCWAAAFAGCGRPDPVPEPAGERQTSDSAASTADDRAATPPQAAPDRQDAGATASPGSFAGSETPAGNDAVAGGSMPAAAARAPRRSGAGTAPADSRQPVGTARNGAEAGARDAGWRTSSIETLQAAARERLAAGDVPQAYRAAAAAWEAARTAADEGDAAAARLAPELLQEVERLGRQLERRGTNVPPQKPLQIE